MQHNCKIVQQRKLKKTFAVQYLSTENKHHKYELNLFQKYTKHLLQNFLQLFQLKHTYQN